MLQFLFAIFPILISLGACMYSKKTAEYLLKISLGMVIIGFYVFIYFGFYYSIPITLSNGDIINIFPYSAQSFLVLVWGICFFWLYVFHTRIRHLPRQYNI